ncbi:CehA/McbA family metallohydrolase [bacterium]|nr:CehA/McbA family metallohydrolase [bacterium]
MNEYNRHEIDHRLRTVFNPANETTMENPARTKRMKMHNIVRAEESMVPMSKMRCLIVCSAWIAAAYFTVACSIDNWGTAVWAADNLSISVEPKLLHLRNAEPQEWASFPKQADAPELNLEFESVTNNTPGTLTLTQSDVKESWTVTLNSKRLGQLVRDENQLRTDFLIPVGTLKEGKNQLSITCRTNAPADDIRVGQIIIHSAEPVQLRSSATLQIAIMNQEHILIPGRITLTSRQGTLLPLGTKSGNGLAIREGVVYTANGQADLAIAPGEYRITAGRGFEYSTASALINVAAGETAKRTLILERQVATDNWIACDTHVHTVTHSGHGDCTTEERMATLAGEGIEFPIATDHNKQIDYRPIAATVGVTSYFTPVIGNEVTTKHGHFNVFPAVAGGRTPDHNELDWEKLLTDIYSTPNVRVAILNHARDLHSSFRPFSPRHHLSLTGDNLDGWQQNFNAMELINSGAVQTDTMELFTDWCGLINHGLRVTPVGCSDSHDVSRYIVGQGRTYIQADDDDPGSINSDAALDSFLNGRVIVSYGLLVKLEVRSSTDLANPHGPGDTFSVKQNATDGQSTMLEVTAKVLAPHWSHPRKVQLFINGEPKFTAEINSKQKRGQPFATTVRWKIPAKDLPNDAWLTAVATGAGIQSLHWPTAKPYQPDSPAFESKTFSCTGPIWLDTDGDGTYRSPRDHAKQLLSKTPLDSKSGKPDLRVLAKTLAEHDSAVVNQTLALLLQNDIEPTQLIAAGIGKRGREFERQWRQTTQARVEQRE